MVLPYSFLNIYFISCAISFSAIFWMTNSIDYFGWSIVELLAVALGLRLLLIKKTLLLPPKKFMIPFLLLILWVSVSLKWSCNFHATLTGLYKTIFILLFIIIFLNDYSEWQNAVQTCSIIYGVIALAGLILFPNSARFWIIHPNLFTGFIALTGILSTGLFLSSTGKKQRAALFAALFIPSSLFIIGSWGAALSWGFGNLLLFFQFKSGLINTAQKTPVRPHRNGIHWFFHPKMKKAYLFGLLISLLLAASLLYIPNNRLIWNKKRGDAYSFERIQIWKDSLDYFLHYPVSGSGLGTYRDVYPEFKKIPGTRNAPYAHNEILNILCEMGVVGFLLLGWALFPVLGLNFFKMKEFSQDQKIWYSAAWTAMAHSLLDFNLRYPPILLLFIFSICAFATTRELNLHQRGVKIGIIFLLALQGFLFFLPGLASLIFSLSYAVPEQRVRAARIAAQLDPWNGHYRFESKRVRDLFFAITLEPRNVWYRRSAAQFFVQEGEKNKDSKQLQLALEQYNQILKYAPNVVFFQTEAESISLKYNKMVQSGIDK